MEVPKATVYIDLDNPQGSSAPPGKYAQKYGSQSSAQPQTDDTTDGEKCWITIQNSRKRPYYPHSNGEKGAQDQLSQIPIQNKFEVIKEVKKDHMGPKTHPSELNDDAGALDIKNRGKPRKISIRKNVKSPVLGGNSQEYFRQCLSNKLERATCLCKPKKEKIYDGRRKISPVIVSKRQRVTLQWIDRNLRQVRKFKKTRHRYLEKRREGNP